MTNLVDLSAKPYELDAEAIQWVEDTLDNMSLDEKIGQLFVNMGSERSEDYLTDVIDNYHISAVRYNKGPATEIYDQNKILQSKSPIPMLIAANTEAGGDGAVTDGTKVGDEVKVAATSDPHYGYLMGKISGQEASAVGCNVSFAPIVDLTRNWHNPIISNRTWGADVQETIDFSLQYMKGITEEGILPFAKHFPGDGISERDQHLSFSPNTLDKKTWLETYGKIYQALIDAGLPGIMAGHIHLPNVEKEMHPEYEDKDILPATLSKTLLDELLRGELHYNGAIVTDASHMLGMTGAMSRREMLPTAIEAGCDMFLFFNDPDEDFQWMKEGYENGLLSEERLNDAIRRTLGLKAKIDLHKKSIDDIFLPKEEALKKINTEESQAVVREVADKAITLVKDEQKDIFPVTAERYKRILLVPVQGLTGGFGAAIAGNKPKAVEYLKELLEKRGHEVSVWESLESKVMKLPEEERATATANIYAQKRPISDLTDNYDLIINVSDVNSGGTIQRIIWPASKGTPDIPFYIHEVPTIFVSIQNPFDLADVPQVGTYINTYDGMNITMEELVKKLTGESEFKGHSSVDEFAGLWDTQLWRTSDYDFAGKD